MKNQIFDWVLLTCGGIVIVRAIRDGDALTAAFLSALLSILLTVRFGRWIWEIDGKTARKQFIKKFGQGHGKEFADCHQMFWVYLLCAILSVLIGLHNSSWYFSSVFATLFGVLAAIKWLKMKKLKNREEENEQPN